VQLVPFDHRLEKRRFLHDDGAVAVATEFLGDVMGVHDTPQAFLVEYRGASLGAHFHHVRQFQVFVDGTGRVGRHSVAPYGIHYVDPDSPYGPIVPDGESVSFFTLRPRGVQGSYFMPGARDRMIGRAGRNLVIQTSEGEEYHGVRALAEEQSDGLAVSEIRRGPGEPLRATAGPAGAYVLVCEGSLTHDGAVLERLSLIWLEGRESSRRVYAGDAGAYVLVLSFPTISQREQEGVAAELASPQGDAPYRESH
jgi:hypothetical protein